MVKWGKHEHSYVYIVLYNLKSGREYQKNAR